MTMRVIGAGLPRTGTLSLREALKVLLGRPCYHMQEVFAHPEHVAVWHAAALGREPNWAEFLRSYGASVDAPAAYFWPELVRAFPEAIVLLSVRDADSWWESASETVFRTRGLVSPEWDAMNDAIRTTRFPTPRDSRESAIRGFELHNGRVRREVPGHRLLEWRASDGWPPICKALELPVPDQPFPHINSREDWRSRNRDRL